MTSPFYLKTLKSHKSLFYLLTPLILILLVGMFLTAPIHAVDSQAENQQQESLENKEPVSSCKDRSNPATCAGFKTIENIFDFMAFLVVPIASLVIIVGGIQYSAAGGNPEATKKAFKRIIAGATALLSFIIMWGFLKWLIPGGLG